MVVLCICVVDKVLFVWYLLGIVISQHLNVFFLSISGLDGRFDYITAPLTFANSSYIKLSPYGIAGSLFYVCISFCTSLFIPLSLSISLSLSVKLCFAQGLAQSQLRLSFSCESKTLSNKLWTPLMYRPMAHYQVLNLLIVVRMPS